MNVISEMYLNQSELNQELVNCNLKKNWIKKKKIVKGDMTAKFFNPYSEFVLCN